MSTLTKAQVVSALGYTPPEQDTVYTHPSTHPASMITDLQSVINTYGYAGCVVGTGSTTGELSFTPKFAFMVYTNQAFLCINIAGTTANVRLNTGTNPVDFNYGYTDVTFGSNSVSFPSRITGYVVIG